MAEVEITVDELTNTIYKKAKDAKKKARAAGGTGGGGKGPTIFKVPDKEKSSSRRVYEPSFVSLGPYHHPCHHHSDKRTIHGDELTIPIEDAPNLITNDHKYLYLIKFLDRLSTKEKSSSKSEMLKLCLAEMKKLEKEARKAYSDEIEINKINSDDFVEMMLLDGCFVIETLLDWVWQNDGDLQNMQEPSIVSTTWSLREVARDMLLLENQLPLSILRCLYDQLKIKNSDELFNFIHHFTVNICAGDVGKFSPRNDVREYHHILHFIHYCITQYSADSAISETSSTLRRAMRAMLRTRDFFKVHFSELLSPHRKKKVPLWIPSATELKDAGVRCRRKDNIKKSFIDIDFKGRELWIPPLVVDELTNVLFRNLLSFEFCYYKHHNTGLTSYVGVMDRIVNTADDIVLLKKDRIVINASSDNIQVAKFFNDLGKDFPNDTDRTLDKFYENVNKQCGSKYNRWFEIFRNTYFENPWTVITLIAAVFLFALTAIQTVYTVLPYVRPK